jgi:hypothetical protein
MLTLLAIVHDHKYLRSCFGRVYIYDLNGRATTVPVDIIIDFDKPVALRIGWKRQAADFLGFSRI